MHHAKTIEKYNGSLKELTRDIKNLDYDVLVELLSVLVQWFGEDAVHDAERKHTKVSHHLRNISQALQKIIENDAQPMADICRRYNERGIK